MSLTIYEAIEQSSDAFKGERAVFWPTYFKDHIAKERYQEVITEQEILAGKVSQIALCGGYIAIFAMATIAPALLINWSFAVFLSGAGLIAGLAFSRDSSYSFSSYVEQNGRLFACLTKEQQDKYVQIRLGALVTTAIFLHFFATDQIMQDFFLETPVIAASFLLGALLGDVLREKIITSQ